MVGAIILTFIITALSMLVLFQLEGSKRKDVDHSHLLKENDGLRRQIADYTAKEQRRRECSAYDRGLYDGRTTDTYYRQCLKKFTSGAQANVMMNGESEENERYE